MPEVTKDLIRNRLNLGKPILRPKEMTDEQKLIIASFLMDRMKDSFKAMVKFDKLSAPPSAPGAKESFNHWYKVNQTCRYFLSMIGYLPED